MILAFWVPTLTSMLFTSQRDHSKPQQYHRCGPALCRKSTHVLDIKGLKDPSIKFWSLWENDNLLGCGALKFLDKEHGEFKSIRVSNKFRQKGYGKKIISYLISMSEKLGIKKLSVETGAGNFFLPARKLFLNCGFKPCKPFAHYKEDPNSCFFTKNRSYFHVVPTSV